MTSRFLQIHTLTSYPASLLNRDDAGFAKRMPFGGATRTRISSQCQKRHWRVFDGSYGLSSIQAPESVRSRESFERFIVRPLAEDGIDEGLVRFAVQKLVDKVLGSEAKKAKATKKAGKKSKEDAETGDQEDAVDERVKTAQVTVVGMPELAYLREVVRSAIDENGNNEKQVEKSIDAQLKDRAFKDNLRALMPGSLEAGLGAALFGRMVTGDILARTDAAIHVAHAMTVHAQMTESDYFSAIDDLTREDGEQGSGHINASELTSGLYYGYVVVDVKALMDNLGDNAELAGEVVERLVRMVATVSPGAKRGSTAPYAYSHFVLVESGSDQPRTLQNAFLEPVASRGGLIPNTYKALAEHLKGLDAMYGASKGRAHAGIQSEDYFGKGLTLADLAIWARERVKA